MLARRKRRGSGGGTAAATDCPHSNWAPNQHRFPLVFSAGRAGQWKSGRPSFAERIGQTAQPTPGFRQWDREKGGATRAAGQSQKQLSRKYRAGFCCHVCHLCRGRIAYFTVSVTSMKRRKVPPRRSLAEEKSSGQESLPRRPHRQLCDPAFRPHTTWRPGRRAPRGTLGGVARRGRAAGWGPRRRPEPRQARARPGPARPAFPRPADSCGELERRRPAHQRRRHGEARGSAESRRAGGWAPRSFAGCGRSPAGARPLAKLALSKPASSDAGVERQAEGERPAGAGVSSLREAPPGLGSGGQPSRGFARSLGVRCFHFLSPHAAPDARVFPEQRVSRVEKKRGASVDRPPKRGFS